MKTIFETFANEDGRFATVSSRNAYGEYVVRVFKIVFNPRRNVRDYGFSSGYFSDYRDDAIGTALLIIFGTDVVERAQ